jgi:hypothetical protein
MKAAALIVCLALVPTLASAQIPQRRGGAGTADMQAIADALGVDCEYCHTRTNVTASGKARIDVAREMILMTADLNARVKTAIGIEPAGANRVDCVTCHRGVPLPRQLRDLMLETAVRQGPDAAVTLYRDLRAKYFGGQSYDFSEPTLLAVADRLAQSRPEAAVALADLNLEFFPKSWRSYMAKGIAQTRRLDTTPAAVESFRKALEIDPDNGILQGWLAQTEPVAKRVR